MNPQIFQNVFFARAMHQVFNTKVENFASDEHEPALRKWAIAHGKLEVSWPQ